MEYPLRVAFPRLYSLSIQKEALVGEMWAARDGVGEWSLLWRRNLFVWEIGLVNDLLLCLGAFEVIGDCDSWVWKLVFR